MFQLICNSMTHVRTILWLPILLSIAAAGSLWACPFCGVVEPSFAHQRESADWLLLIEAIEPVANKPQFLVHRVLKAPVGDTSFVAGAAYSVRLPAALSPGSLALAWSNRLDEAELKWSAMPVNELSLQYFTQAPDLRQPAARRLQYFVRFIQHADPAIAEDAFREFGLADFEAVDAVADRFSSQQLRAWLTDATIPQGRCGFFGLLLGLASNAADREANRNFLREQITRTEDDFRAGFDGQLAGYLLLTGEEGLKLLEQLFLENSQAAVGNVRHALAAVRFYQQYGKQIDTPRLAAAVAKVLSRAEFAESAIIDLARWQAWNYAEPISSLYDKAKFNRPEIKRAIIGYLLACPTTAGRQQLTRLRQFDPQGVAAAEDVLHKLHPILE